MKCTWPAIDHTLLSPSGRVSKRARAAAEKVEFARLFKGADLNPTIPQPSERDSDLRYAAELRALAARGFQPRKMTKEATRLEQKWAAK